MEAIAAAAATASAGGAELFSYNRENYFFDKELYMKRAFQSQGMRVKQFELYREDVRDLIGLTVGKMENYLIVNTLQLGFCVAIFTEGRLEASRNTEPWLVCLLMMCNVGAFLYYLLSVWLAMHASVAAHSFGVRLLTQYVRLPVPSKAEIDSAVGLSSQYESARVRDLLRVPVWKQQLQRLNATMADSTDDADEDLDAVEEELRDGPFSPVAALQHVRLFRRLQGMWQSYDAYSRVCMAMGTNQLLHTFTYYCLVILIGGNHVPWPAFCCVVIFTTCAWILARLDLNLSLRMRATTLALLVAPPLLITCTISGIPMSTRMQVHFVVPLAFALHVVWVVFTVRIAEADEFDSVALPRAFRSVLYLDVFGWLTASAEAEQQQARRAIPEVLRGFHVKKLVKGLDEDLERWLDPLVRDQLADAPDVLEELEGLKVKFDELRGKLPENMGGARVADRTSPNGTAGSRSEESLEPVAEHSPREGGEKSNVWLKLVHQAELGPMDYYYQVETEDYVFNSPPEGRILEPGDIKTRMLLLDEFVLVVEESTPVPSQAPTPQLPVRGHNPASSASSSSSRPGTPVAASASNVSGNPRVRTAKSNVTMWVRSILGDQERDEVEDQNFGGREAARATNADGSENVEQYVAAAETDFFQSAPQGESAPAAEAAQASAAALAETGGSTAPNVMNAGNSARTRKRSGHLPWYTFRDGSIVLVFVWSCGTIWAVMSFGFGFRTPFFDNPVPPDLSKHEDAWELPVSLAATGTWPHPFLRPVAMGCPLYGDVQQHQQMLVAEKYKVLVLNASAEAGGAVSAPSGALARCVAALDGRGIASMSIQCSKVGCGRDACAALILATDGETLFSCPLGDKPAVEKPRRWKLLGGGWRVIAAAATSGVWASNGASIVFLDTLPGRPDDELMPRFELPQDETTGNITQLVEFRGQALIGLDSEGLLRVWPLEGPRTVIANYPGHLSQLWRLPPAARLAAKRGEQAVGSGLCEAQDGHLYFAGPLLKGGRGGRRARLEESSLVADAAPALGIWRVDMPADAVVGGHRSLLRW
eukprot:TRINITY_DN32596_c0_g1_i1.p1 TRINITY_DN32596_c0_g1~~TRINITY_DN32596_c0_g1_i1.p1  ORF type:complete len:1049 (+),score=243.33 TRINITY_DN32596_c0_g1_i1:114-3260(+)